jgi:uncharacterized phage protein (TIGR02218 family)
MRSWSPTLVANLASEEATRCFMIEANNGITPVVRLTDIDKDLTVGLNTFAKSPGFTVSKWTVASGGRPSSIDFNLAIDANGPIYAEHVKRGAWRGALITIWIGDFTNPSDRAILVSGFIGLTQSTDRLSGKMQGITKADALADIILYTVQPKCSLQYGSLRCGATPTVFTATVATVTNNGKFTITVTNPDNLDLTHGKIVFTSGANAGAEGNTRRWVSGTSLVESVLPFPFDIQVGDALTISDGCDLSRAGPSGCKFHNNINRFTGFDKTPGELLGGT